MIEIPILIVIGAIILDLALGDPKNKYHPTAWIGIIIAKLVPFAKTENARMDMFTGTILTVFVSAFVVILLLLYGLLITNLSDIISKIIIIIIGAILLKTTIAVKGLQKHGHLVITALSTNNIEDARDRLSMLVKRNTKHLDREHIISGVLESTSESIVDGITGPLFYFGLFGLPGAFVYRTINTIDSMIGYKNDLFKNVGWFGANSDKILNYLPSRITACVMVLAAFLTGADWKNAFFTMIRDGRKTSSPNAGYPMATMAGALRTRFEKIDHYVLGNGTVELDVDHFRSAILLMKITCILFCGLVTIPLIILLDYLGWLIYV